ncbi:MAG: TetR/AcrR family transcriptional regulator [Sciscionella sp.]
MDPSEPGPASRSKRLPRAVRERQILDAAVGVFSELGYHAASMDEISTAANISKPMIYAYLGAKEDLFRVCIQRESTRLLESVTAQATVELPADEQLWFGLLAFFSHIEANRDGWRVLHRHAVGAGAPFAAEISGVRSRAVSLVAALVVTSASTAIHDGVGAAAVRSGESLAAALVGAAESLADWWIDHPGDAAEVMAVRLMNLIWMGFGDLIRDRQWRAPTALRPAEPEQAQG